MSVGANIRRIREEQAMLCQIERETKNPSLQVSVEIAALLDCDVKDLCDNGRAAG